MNSKPVTESPPNPYWRCHDGGQTHALWWYAHLEGMLLSVEKIIPALNSWKMTSLLLCHRVIQTKGKAAWMTRFYFCLLEAVICVTLFIVSVKTARVSLILSEKEWNTKCFFTTQLIFRDWVKFGDRSWSVSAWPILVSDLCDNSWPELTLTHL